MIPLRLTMPIRVMHEAMGIGWDDVAFALTRIRSFVREAWLWYSILDEVEITPEFVAALRERITAAYGPWKEPSA